MSRPDRFRRSPAASGVVFDLSGASFCPMVCLIVCWMVCMMIGGCTVGPDFARPDTLVDEAPGYVHAAEASSALPSADIDPWWRGFGDPATEELVERALAANTDLQAASARVLEASARFRSVRASRLPEVTAGVGVSRAETTFVLPQTGRVFVDTTTYSDELAASYVVDLFGRLRRSREAALADLASTRAAREALAHTVVAQTVRGRVSLSNLERARELAEAVRTSWERTLESVDRRYRSGLVGALDVRLARENLASAEVRVVELESQIDQARLGLDVLLGVRPGTGPRPAELLPALPSLEPLPLGLPAALLERRPDVRQAEARLAAETARIGVATADLYPNLSLTGSLGIRSDSASDLVSTSNLLTSVAANLAAPVFDGGRRRAEVRAARARADEAAALYAGAVLEAVREVEDALAREAAQQRKLARLEARLDEARAADGIARERWQRGVETFLRVLETERRLRAAEDAAVTARADLWNTRIDLYLALGGDWLDTPRTEPNAISASVALTDVPES